MRQVATAGFTLVELLLTTVILLLLLAFAGALLSQGSSLHRQTSERSLQQEELDSVTQLLMYDFRLAGYQGAASSPMPLNQAISANGNAVVVRYSLDGNPDRPYEVPGSQRITCRVERDDVLTRCHATDANPTECIGGKTELAEGVLSLTADTSSLAGHGVIIGMLTTPYGCNDSSCATPYTVRIPFPQPLIGAQQ